MQPREYTPPRISELEGPAHLVKELKKCLDAEGKQVRDQIEKTLARALANMPLGDGELTKQPDYWSRLADACSAIGSQTIDRIEKRLVLIGHTLRWNVDTDYRTLAHQIYMATEQARKLSNVYFQRRKCVRAVLRTLELENGYEEFQG